MHQQTTILDRSGAVGRAAAAGAAGRRLSPWAAGTSLPSGLGECTGDI